MAMQNTPTNTSSVDSVGSFAGAELLPSSDPPKSFDNNERRFRLRWGLEAPDAFPWAGEPEGAGTDAECVPPCSPPANTALSECSSTVVALPTSALEETGAVKMATNNKRIAQVARCGIRSLKNKSFIFVRPEWDR